MRGPVQMCSRILLRVSATVPRKRGALKRTVVELRTLLPHELAQNLPQERSVLWDIRNRSNR